MVPGDTVTMRTKNVTMDGASFKLAPLNLEQVERFTKEETTVHDVILWSLQNAGLDWDEDKLRKELDVVLRQFLFDEILLFSGLKQQESKQPGEAGAVSGTSLPKSGAA